VPAMTTFTIDDVDQNIRDVPTQYGPMKDYRLSLMASGETTPVIASWLRKASSPAPVRGQQIEGALEDTEYGKKFREQRQMPIGSSGGGGKSYAADPKKQAAIAMEASQKVAVDIMRLYYQQAAKAPDSAGELVSQVKQVAAALFGQIEEVSK
jgi:hypothetical protein